MYAVCLTILTSLIFKYGMVCGSAIEGLHDDVMNYLWKRNFCLEKEKLTGVVAISTTSSSLLHCALMCSMTTTCTVMSYNDTSESCLGISTFDSADVSFDAQIIHPKIYSPVANICDMRLAVHTVRKTFDEASATCDLYCGRLVVLDTAEKQRCISTTTGLKYAYWIGLTDKKVEGEWLWIDGSTFVRHQNILPGVFNNFDRGMEGAMKYTADCAVYSSKDKEIFDENCQKPVRFICEIL